MRQGFVFLFVAAFSFVVFIPAVGAQDMVITVQRAQASVNSGFKERIYIDGKQKLVLANGESGTIRVPAGEHTIHAVLYTLTTDEVRFNAQDGISFVVTPNSMSDFVIELVDGSGYPLQTVDAAAESALARLNAKTQPAPAPAPAPTRQPAPTRAQPAARPAPAKSNRGSTPIEKALYAASDQLIEELPDNATVAVISIASDNREFSEFVIDELAYILVDTKKFKVVDRKSLDAIQEEQKFQRSGDVDDKSAVSLGKKLGASIVITGSAGGSGPLQRLRVKALDVKTAEIVSMASEKF